MAGQMPIKLYIAGAILALGFVGVPLMLQALKNSGVSQPLLGVVCLAVMAAFLVGWAVGIYFHARGSG